MNILDLIQNEFSIAANDFAQINQQWVNASYKLSGTLVHLLTNIQTDGRTDLILRAIEREIQRDRNQLQEKIFAFDRYSSLSRSWLITMYENLRTYCQFNKSQLGHDPGPFYTSVRNLTNQFALVRVPLAKLEIQRADKKSAPEIFLIRTPSRAEDRPERYARGSMDYAPRAGIDERTGSILWGTIDIETKQEIWISRQKLADDFLQLCGKRP